MSSPAHPARRAPSALRYDAVAVALHWLVGAALLAQIAFGFLLDPLAPRGTPARAGVVNLHKSFGVLLAAFILLRLAWRLTHAPPPWPASMRPWQQRAAQLWHRALYACMLLLPLSGYLASNLSKHGIRFFGHPWPAWGPDWPAAYGFFNGLHGVTAWVLCALIGGHVAAALKHALSDRDGVLTRIMPGRAP
jgi:cytochrome b561